MTLRHPSTPAWWRLFLAALLVGMLGAGTASAATPTVAETRVGASTPATAYVVGPHECLSAGQQWGKAPPQAEVTAGSCVAAESGSALSRASQAAFRAADDPASIFVKNKHLTSAGGNGAKFASDDIGQVQGWISRGLQSDGVQFLPNQLDDTFRAIVPGGGVVGTRGQDFIRVIVTGDGRVINAFPVNVR